MQPPVTTPVDPAAAASVSTSPAAAPRKDWKAWAKKNWMLLGAGSLVVVFVGLYLWVQSAVNDMAGTGPTVAGSTEHIEGEVLNNEVVMPQSGDKTKSYDDLAAQEYNASPAQQVTVDELQAQQRAALGLDSVEARKQEKKRISAEQAIARDEIARTARNRNMDTVVVTARDPHTGQYTQRRQAYHRTPATNSAGFVGGSGSGGGSYNGGSRYARPTAARTARRPLRDRDGALYETNDEVNAMLREGGPDVQKAYERMTGRRYRPLDSDVELSEQNRKAMQYVPGMDGFYTVKYRGRTASPADDAENAVAADPFYRAVISGTQNVRSGSVVLLRFDEDVTLQGVPFPRNQLMAAVVSVETNRVTFQIDRIGPYRIAAQVYNTYYMPGIMIDPSKRAPAESQQGFGQTAMSSGLNDLSSSIDRSQSAANSVQGIAGRMGVTMLQRMPQRGRKLREVLLPDGYPVLITVASQDAAGSPAQRSTGPIGQDGNPLQSSFMSGNGQGGYAGQERGNR
ncbi:conjugative transposon protein TraM [Hymenobacter endophyticus]|uniref:Conjugative transposon protein TraM n=1 Tax=Hymenobacter endophyticus TaxID=3076335 RepID=A0ABU3TL43_9BACT|nr:conjugative transposon protein TraM [Hymenobacter endophyticus]MDU0372092.1 conjugative transposon protein TraM [Hymenobacter endophyticus]